MSNDPDKVWPTGLNLREAEEVHSYLIDGTRVFGVIALIAPALALTCLFLAPDAVQVVAAQALRARGEVWVPTITHLISYGVIMGPLAWWLAIPMGLGVNGIVWSVIVTSFVSMAFLLARFRMLDVKDRSL